MTTVNATDVHQIVDQLVGQKHELDSLRRRVELLEQDTPHTQMNSARDAIATQSLEAVLQVTRELFGAATADWLDDPDNPNSRFLVVEVEAEGTPQQLLAQSLDWHEKIEVFDPHHLGAFRLSINPRE